MKDETGGEGTKGEAWMEGWGGGETFRAMKGERGKVEV